ncbi:MAG: molecular chaperone TorD family protein [Eubacteriales bacterium]
MKAFVNEKSCLIETTKYRIMIYRLLEKLFMEPIPTPGKDFTNKVLKAINDLDMNNKDICLNQGIEILKAFHNKSLLSNIETLQKELAVDRTMLCRGINSEYGPPPPYEAVYMESENQQTQILKVIDKYNKMQISVSSEVRERPDYIGLEFAFMAFLCEKELEVYEGKQEEYEEIIRLETEFLTEHLFKWIPKYCDEMIKWAKTDFFKGIGYLIKGYISEEKERNEEQEG